MSYRLLGAHVNSTVSGLPEAIKAWKPPLVVVLDHSDVWRSVKEESPNTHFVGRIYRQFEPNFNEPRLDASRAARYHCDRVLPWAERMGETYSYWQGVNEPIIESPDAMRRCAEFDAERARIMHDNGFRVVVGSFSVGNPTDMSYWRYFLPALEAAHQYKGALALHEYAWPTLDHKWPWYILRHRKVYDGEPEHFWEGLPDHLNTLPLLITECGLDGLIERGDRPRGWRTHNEDNPIQYLRQLAWYDAQLQKDPYVIGAAIYCLATPDPVWKSYDIWPLLVKVLARYAKPVYRLPKEEPSQPPDQPPVDTGVAGHIQLPNVVWRMETSYQPGPKVIAGAFPRRDLELSITDPWGNVSTVVSGSKPEHGYGGFEMLAPNIGTYTLEFLDQSFKVRTQNQSTIVVFTETSMPVEPPDTRPPLPPEEEARWKLVMERLERITTRLQQYY